MKFSEYNKNYLAKPDKLPIDVQNQIKYYEESNLFDFESCSYLSEAAKGFLRNDKGMKKEVDEFKSILKGLA